MFAVLLLAGVAEVTQTVSAVAGFDALIWYSRDFPALHAAATLVAQGSGSLMYNVNAIGNTETQLIGQAVGGSGTLAYFNPPFFAGALAPLAALSPARAYQAWAAVNLVVLAGEVWMLWRIAAPLPRTGRIAVVAAFGTLFPVAYGLQIGQFSLILAASWTAAYLLMRRGREGWAGASLSLLLIKPELLIPIGAFLVWKRRWAMLRPLAALTVIAVLVSVVIVGIGGALAYPGYLMDSTTWQASGVATNVMFNLNGILAMVSARPTASPLGAAALAGLSMGTIAVVAWSLRGAIDFRSPRFAMQWMLLTLATLLLDPHLYLQDTILVAPAAVAMLASARPEQRATIGAVIAAGWGVLALGIYPNEHLNTNAFGLFMAAALLATAALTCRRDRDERGAYAMMAA